MTRTSARKRHRFTGERASEILRAPRGEAGRKSKIYQPDDTREPPRPRVYPVVYVQKVPLRQEVSVFFFFLSFSSLFMNISLQPRFPMLIERALCLSLSLSFCISLSPGCKFMTSSPPSPPRCGRGGKYASLETGRDTYRR